MTNFTSPPQALQLCSHFNLTDYFLDSCVFDLITTGDSYFRQAAAAAQSELWTQDPYAAASTLKNCTEWPCEFWYTSGTNVPHFYGAALILVLLVLVLW